MSYRPDGRTHGHAVVLVRRSELIHVIERPRTTMVHMVEEMTGTTTMPIGIRETAGHAMRETTPGDQIGRRT